MSSDTLPGERDVLSAISALQIMCPNGEMPKEFRAGFWRVMDDAYAEIYRLRAENRSLRAALGRFREDRERLLARIEFASQPIGNCGHCLVGNKPGEHHLPDCPAFRVESSHDSAGEKP